MIIEQERFKDYADSHIYVTSNGTAVVGVPVEENRYHIDRWQDAHRELVLGIYATGLTLPQVKAKMEELTGYGPALATIWDWLHAAKVIRKPVHATDKIYPYLDLMGAPNYGETKAVVYKLGVTYKGFVRALARWREKKNAKAMHTQLIRET